MKNHKTFLSQFVFMMILGITNICVVSGQTYKPGDLYTFEDGSKGIVFYVNPDDPGSGTVAALQDLTGAYALWTGIKPVSFLNAFVPDGVSFFNITKWENHGKQCTQLLAESGVSPAANAVDVAGGWYIPDLMQLYQLYASAPTLQSQFELHGGDLMSIQNDVHWSVTQVKTTNNDMYCLGSVMRCDNLSGTTAHLIRPVRDFPDSATVKAFWADCPPKTDTTVSPTSTTSYHALAIYRTDTLPLTSTVTVHHATAVTLYDTTNASALPYTPASAPVFSNLNISVPGDYELQDTLQTIHGCDSVITLRLTIINNNSYYSETLCPLETDYYFAPFDTVFTPGTISGIYEHHGSKMVDGVTVDTAAYFNLEILPVYEIFDTVEWCLYNPAETRVYDGNAHISIAVNEESVAVTSHSGTVVVEEVTVGEDYMLKMQTANGCDSIIRLHVNARRVIRDTLNIDMAITQLTGNQVTVACHTFTGVTGAGTYTIRDTLTAANGCDSLLVAILSVSPCATGFSLTCPPDVYDTLGFGDCAMKVHPDHLSAPTLHYDSDWPFRISNDYPIDSLFPQGDNIVTWTATDTVCGNSVTCEQHVVIAFPQCPDAVDFEGNVYHGVRIGCDCWTQRNLESTKYSDGNNITEKYAYKSAQSPDTTANVATFGRLYSYDAAIRDSADNGHGHIQGICPEGWYLPTPEKYEGLNVYGASALRSPAFWAVGGGNNSTGFTALPAGFYNGWLDRYEGLLLETFFWSTQGVKQATATHVFTINYYCEDVQEQHPLSGLGFSVRCIKEK